MNTIPLMNADPAIKKLRESSKAVSVHSYSPYSKFKIGATLVIKGGKTFSGTNVENASFGLSMCAERNAIFQAVAHGEQQIETMAIYSPLKTHVVPCGVCLQVMIEFMQMDSSIYLFCESDDYIKEPFSYFLPHPFLKESLLNRD